MQVYFDKDANPALISNKKIGIIGYGNQGRVQALNLRDSGVHVEIGLRLQGKSASVAKQDGFVVREVAALAALCDVLMLLVPDEIMGELYDKHIAPAISAHTALGFAHGFAIQYRLIKPDAAGDVFMISPKGTGESLRANYLQGTGLPSYVAIAKDKSGKALPLALAYAQAIGCTKRGSYPTSFREETESDLFSEQSVLCGALGVLIKKSYEVLVEAGFSPNLAYFECLTEAKLVCDLLVNGGGFDNFYQKISNTAEYGGYLASEEILPADLKARMQKLLQKIQQGKFAEEFVADYQNEFKKLKEYRKKNKNHPIDKIARELAPR